MNLGVGQIGNNRKSAPPGTALRLRFARLACLTLDLNAHRLQELSRALTADQSENEIVLKARLFLAAPRVRQHHLVVVHFLDGAAEENLDTFGVHAIVDIHFIAEFQIALEVAAHPELPRCRG